MREAAYAAESLGGVIGNYRKAQRRRRQRAERGATWTIWKSLQFDVETTGSGHQGTTFQEHLSWADALQGILTTTDRQQLVKPSIVIARLRRLSTQTPSPKKSLSRSSAPSKLQGSRSIDFTARSQLRTKLSPQSFQSWSERLSPAMRFFGERLSASDTDSTAPSSNLDVQSEVDKDDPAALRWHCRRDSQVIKSIEAKTEEIWPYCSATDSPGRNCLSGMPAGVMQDDAASPKGGQEMCLSVKTGREDDDTHKLQLLLGTREEVQTLVDTMGTLSPVPSNPLMVSSSSLAEDGLTLFVNPMVYCETADEDTLTEAPLKSARSYSMDLDEVLGLPKSNGLCVENYQLKKVEEKMVQQVWLAEPKSYTKEPQMLANKVDQELSRTKSMGAEEERVQTISIEEKVLALRSGPSVLSGSTQKVQTANGLARSWSVKPWHEQRLESNRNGIGHCREDSVWDCGVASRPSAPFCPKPEPKVFNTRFKLSAKNRSILPMDDVKAAKRRAFVKSRSMKEARNGGVSHWSPSAHWTDERSLDDAVEEAFKNVKPITLVRKGACLPSIVCDSSSRNSWKGIPSIRARLIQTADSSWCGDLQPNSLWSEEAPTMMSNSVWSDVDDWAPKTREDAMLDTTELAESRDRLWGGLCIGILAWLAILI